MADWTGNTKSVYSNLGASSHSEGERESNDYYATDPRTVDALCRVEKFTKFIWEPACGEGHISKVLEDHGYDVWSTDIIYRGYGDEFPLDFLSYEEDEVIDDDIVTNPPYKYAKEFVEKALSLVRTGGKVAMLLKIQFLEGKARKEFYKKYPPKIVYVFSERQECAKNGNFTGGSAVCYCWFVWEKGFEGDPIIKWL